MQYFDYQSSKVFSDKQVTDLIGSSVKSKQMIDTYCFVGDGGSECKDNVNKIVNDVISKKSFSWNYFCVNDNCHTGISKVSYSICREYLNRSLPAFALWRATKNTKDTLCIVAVFAVVFMLYTFSVVFLSDKYVFDLQSIYNVVYNNVIPALIFSFSLGAVGVVVSGKFSTLINKGKSEEYINSVLKNMTFSSGGNLEKLFKSVLIKMDQFLFL